MTRPICATLLTWLVACQTGAPPAGGAGGAGGSGGSRAGGAGGRGGAAGSGPTAGTSGGSVGSGGSGGSAGSTGTGGSAAGGTAGAGTGTGGSDGGSGGSASPDAAATGGAGGAGGSGGSTPGAIYPPPPPPIDPNCMPSRHYGKDGDMWKPDGRIVDPSYAGYRTGIVPIPNVEGPVKRVTEFGAMPDDNNDDSAGFLAAIAAVNEGVLLVPAGRYIITKHLEIRNKANWVLRGEGPDKTKLVFPKPLSDPSVSTATTNWSFNGGFISVSGTDEGAVLAMVTANAPRGSQQLQVSATTGINVGDWVRLIQTDRAGTLFRALYGGMHAGNVSEDGGTEVFRFYSKVTAVGQGTITLERHLPLQVDTNWTPTIRAVKPTTREFGVEHLTLEMQSGTYGGHFNERGYNGIYYVNVHDGWVRNVHILNAELGISIYRSYFVTVTDVVLDSNIPNRGSHNGHHGLNSARGSDILFTRFDLRKRYIHDLTVDGYALATVWSRGKGVDMNMDHHGRAPYGTLWTNLDLGAGTRAFDNGGAGNRLPPTASYTTAWNLYGARNPEMPPSSYGPNMNFVYAGAGGGHSSWSVENIPRASLCQPDLYEAMVAKRKR